MSSFFEIDFLNVESDKSGDAIAIRYSIGETSCVHIVDGGYQATGESVVKHIERYYGTGRKVDHVVLTHPDGDHAGGLRTVLSECEVGALWMLRPWIYVNHLISRFSSITSRDYLARLLRNEYPNIVALEEIANQRGIPIYEPFQGTRIGAFTVMAPTRARYIDLLVQSECTPAGEKVGDVTEGFRAIAKLVTRSVSYIRAAWGEESFSPEDVSAENEMTVVQYANLCGKRILLAGDVGRGGLREAADYAPFIGLRLPGIDRFQVPHHGSRRNLSTELLDDLLGPRLDEETGRKGHFTAIISSAKKDERHPRKVVVRAMIHRGGRPLATNGNTISTFHNAPQRPGWVTAQSLAYPAEQEE